MFCEGILTRFLQSLGFALILLAGPAAAAIAPLEDALAEKSIGRADAPVTIHEYASLSCPHCMRFHLETLPKIKKAYIDTGKVRLVYHDFPLGGLATVATMLARCAGSKKFFGLIELFYREQKKWSRSDTPRDDLERIVRFAGMSSDDFAACLDNEELLNTIEQRKAAAAKKFGINSTPTFFIEGTKVPGNLPFEDFQEIIDKALKKKMK